MDNDEIEFPPDTPEEMQEYLKKRHDEAEMQSQVVRHNLMGFIEALTEDQLDTLLTLLGIMENDESRVPFFAGIVMGERFRRFNRCMACGKNHEAEIMGDGKDTDADS